MKEHILVVDDALELRMLVRSALSKQNYEVSEVASGAELRSRLAGGAAADVVLLDLFLEDANGLDLLPEIRRQWPRTEVVVITGYGTVENAVTAMKLGAYGFLQKPFDVSSLTQHVEHALENRRLREQAEGLRQMVSVLRAEPAPVFQSEPMKKLLRLVEKAAGSSLPVMILGENGTGKEVLAQMLHQLSPRARQPLVRLNCPALGEAQFEACLFGVSGDNTRPGDLRLAGEGTLVLDELSAMPPAMQGRLLGVLQDGQALPSGGAAAYPVKCRLVATTNRPVREALRAGELREDVFYQLSGITLEVPPLRERRDDILPLARAFLERSGGQAARQFEGFSERAAQALERFDWPGNVRQLQNEIQRAALLANGPRIEVEDLCIAAAATPEETEFGLMEAMERKAIVQVLAATHGNLAEAAKRLGVGRQTLYIKMKAYRIET